MTSHSSWDLEGSLDNGQLLPILFIWKNTELQKSLEDKTLEAEKCETAFRSEVSLPISNDGSKDSTTTPTSSSKHKNLGLVRYRSLRDHNGRYYLVVKI